jgi:two-component system, NtrC family, sensor kinase
LRATANIDDTARLAGLERVLIIDDEEGIRKVLRIILAAAGYPVVCAADGKEGLELFETEQPSIVVTDIRMPHVDGIDVLKAIKERSEDAEVIVITGHGEMDLAIQALKLRASDFINKPIGNDAILLAVERASERLAIRRKLRDYTENLENKIRDATRELTRVLSFQTNLIRSSIDGIVGTDRSGEIVVFNRSAQRLSRYAEEEVVGKKGLRDLFPAETCDEIHSLLGGEGSGDSENPALYRDTSLRCKSGEDIPLRLSGTLLHEDGGVVGSVWSIEDLRELRRLEEKLIQNERMAAMGETVAGMAHAVKNILGGLTGGTFVLEKGMELDRDDLVKKGWGMVRRNIERIKELVMDLLSYAKEREPERKPVDPNEVVAEVVELMRDTASMYGVSVTLDKGSLSRQWALDRRWIHRCLANLIGNGIDACSEPFGLSRPGHVTVRTWEDASEGLSIEVSDNGCGMDEEVRRKIFTSFFSTKGSKGTGLGLMLTQKMVREHGGRIEFESTPGVGSVFRMVLPQLPEAPGATVREVGREIEEEVPKPDLARGGAVPN